MKFVIIVAGGKGLRLGSDLPKQFLPIGGHPMLMHTLEAFERACPGIRQILVLPQEQQDFWQALCLRHDFTLPHTIVAGGPTRFHSVQNGLAAIPPSNPISPNSFNRPSGPSPISPVPPTGGVGEEPLVAVHDGVRPFASEAMIRRCFDAARQHGAAVPVIPVIETLRELTLSHSAPGAAPPAFPSEPSPSGSVPGGLSAGVSLTVDRSRYRLVQTPQTFQLPLLRRAYEQPYRETFTDDASVVEALGHAITLVEGNRENIKITTPFDLTIAEALLASAHS